MLAFLLTWCLVALLLHVPPLANAFTVALARRVKSHHDWDIPDDLPQTAGQWLRDRLHASHGAIVTDARARISTDGFHPELGLVQLTDETHFKSDPVYWAIAGHELGHAELHRRHWWFGALAVLARRLKPIVGFLGIGIVVGNLLYGLPGALALAYALLFVGVLLHSFDLVDEAWASYLAYGELRWSADLSPRHLRAVRAVLRTSFLTYLVTYAAHAFLLTQWHVVESITGGGYLGEAAQLTTLGWVAVAVASVVCVAHLVWVIRDVVRPGAGATHGALVQLPWKIALIVLVALAWNLRVDPTWAWCVILAAVPAAGLFVLVAGLPMLPVSLGLHALARRWHGRGLDPTSRYRKDRRAGRRAIEDGNRSLQRLLDAHPTSRIARVLGLVRLAYVPLLVVLWLA